MKVVRASLTTTTKVTDPEGDPRNPGLLEAVQSLSGKLKTLQEEFKTHQLKIIDLTQTLLEEQQALDENNDILSELLIMVMSATPSTNTDMMKVVLNN